MAKKKDNSITIHEIVWTDDLVWQLLAQIELSENRVMLLGKRKKGENTSGDSKVMVYQDMAAAIFPQLHSQNACNGGPSQMKLIILLSLMKKYKGSNLTLTAMSLTTNFLNAMSLLMDPTQPQLRKQCIWDEIVEQFKFFPILHQILSSRLNVTPIAITTGIGPHGRKTIQSLHTALQNKAAHHGILPSFESPFDTIVDPSDYSQPLYDVDNKENDPPCIFAVNPYPNN
ncbi:hypothetical protein EDB19DRAFT_1904807 [Suillus lakei]|nr:hypothetical protein EDB19DRAFT_1904807 [Suillus lakei]